MKDLLIIIITFLSLPISNYAQQETVLEIKPNDQIDKDVFVIVDEPPKFQGGENRKSRFYKKISKFEIAKSRENGCTVYFQMTINEDGSVTDLEIINNPSEILVNEVTKIVQSMPLWIPGKIKGKAVRVKIVQEISFSYTGKEVPL